MWEHALIGLDDNALINGENGNAVIDHIIERYLHRGGSCFAEQYIEGREFNLSTPGGTGRSRRDCRRLKFCLKGIRNKPRIVGYSAKWDEGSFEYHHTPRRFDFSHGDGSLVAKLEDLALRCWRLFGLGGYDAG